MGLSLVAFDTDHIKQYVFGTNKLKEIRGASSLLDYLNRVVMKEFAREYNARTIYAHGGSGLFLIDTEYVDIFKAQVQQAYLDHTGGGASVTAVDQPVSGIHDIDKADNIPIPDELKLLQWRLQEGKARSTAFLVQPSHPLMRLCDACGSRYVDASGPDQEVDDDELDLDEEDERYCVSCQKKRARDIKVKKIIKDPRIDKEKHLDDFLWKKIISSLSQPKMQYDIPKGTRRPKDFNVFRNFKGSKDYLALVYADANNMGRAIEQYTELGPRGTFAGTIDDAVYKAVFTAIARYLKIGDHLKPQGQRSDDLNHPIFPFDILLMGGDDICMVVPASVALDVALTLSETFRSETQRAYEEGALQDPYHTLSVGVVLAPVKYPFGLLQEMAETTLKFAKKEGANARAKQLGDDTYINFMIVTGSTKSNFKHVYNDTYHKKDDSSRQDFYATLRPYTPKDLQVLLEAIRGKDGAKLGRTKLHQIREAILKMNLTTSVSDGLSVLHNWRERPRNHVVHNVYEFAGRYQMPRSDPTDPVSGFPRVIFPWFKDGTKKYKRGQVELQYDVYRTSLLDFVELYDFVSRDGGDNADES